ncbi:MAG: hypothetical protein P8176_09660, partial [Gammaproteobacteria bacterium]
MKYENPSIPEGINYSNNHPLQDFFLMLLVVVGCIIIAIVMLFTLTAHLAKNIPFSTELALAESLTFSASDDGE